MAKRICLVQGHPDARGGRLCHALEGAYAEGARLGGHALERLDVAAIETPFLQDAEAFRSPPTGDILRAQKMIADADHTVFIYPLWLGSMPARLKAFLEQLARGNFFIEADSKGGWPKKLLKGKSARVIVTMGMPAPAYRLMFGKAGVKSMEQGILALAGFSPVKDTLIGLVDGASEKTRTGWLEKMRALGEGAR